MKHGEIWWSELIARDIGTASKFYVDVMGWTTRVHALSDMSRDAEPGEPAYTVFLRDGVPVAGGVAMTALEMPDTVPSHWFTHIAVADVDAACKEVVKAGGKVLREPWDIKGVGRIAIIMDADGTRVGLGTPEAMVKA